MISLGRCGRPRIAALVAAGVLLAGCGRNAGAPPARDTDAESRRARAEALHAEAQDVAALEQLRPLLERQDAAVDDLVRGTILARAAHDPAKATALLDRARAVAPADLAVLYLSGLSAADAVDYATAAKDFRAVLAADPADLAAKMELAEALDAQGQTDEALSLLRQVRAAGVISDTSIYVSATYKLAQALRGQPESDALFKEYDQLGKRGFKALGSTDLEQRGHGRLPGATAAGVLAGPPAAAQWPPFTDGASVDLAGATDLLVADVDADGRPDLVGWGRSGVRVARQDEHGAFHVEVVTERATLAVAAGDVDEADPFQRDAGLNQVGANPHYEPRLELACVHAGEGDAQPALALWSRDAAGAWSRLGPEVAPLPGAHGVVFSDFDHDSLLDVLVATAGGVVVLRNDGALRKPGETLQDATPDDCKRLGASVAVVPEDLDADNDVDDVVVGETRLALLDNRRGGQLADATAAWHAPAGTYAPGEVAVGDVDEDGRADLVLGGAAGLAWARGGKDGFAAPQRLDAGGGGPLVLADLDLDGHVDLVQGGAQVLGRRGPLTGRQSPPAATPLGKGGAALAVADMDGDGDLDLVTLDAGKAQVRVNGLSGAHGVTVTLAGRKDNTRGVGAIVELRAGPLYRRIYARGEPLVFGLGDESAGGLLKVTWPNGVPQFVHDKLLDGLPRVNVEQPMTQGGSCPFLYAWNGTRFEFITDAIGASPLGLPAAPGEMVPYRSHELLKVRGDQLAPRDGRLTVALTEELREVTYLDRLALHAIDHPADVEIQPNDRFTFPPFPEEHVHTLRDVRPVARAVASDGQDVTAQVATADGHPARPFRELSWQYKGLAEPWSVDFTLVDTPEAHAALVAAPKIRLLITGWLQWGDASVNMAAAHHPDVEFVPPVLWVPEGNDPDLAQRTWRPIDPPVGFPAGKTKCMVLDVTDIVRRDDPRLRMTTTLQFALDAVRVCLDADDAPMKDTRLETSRASLAFRGFSRLLSDAHGDQPELFDWQAEMEPRWNQHPGLYTKYGEVGELLSATDDRYVIMGAGDALTAAFDEGALPPLPAGWSRDWLVELDGWAKDGDPNTVTSQSVEPLPFHAMTAYPPPPGESAPDDAAHRDWRAQWNTRPAAVLLVPLADPGAR